MLSDRFLLAVESLDLSQAKKERTVYKPEQTSQNDKLAWEKSRDSTPNSQKLEDM